MGLSVVPPVPGGHQPEGVAVPNLTNAFISSYRKREREPQRSGTEETGDWQLARAACILLVKLLKSQASHQAQLATCEPVLRVTRSGCRPSLLMGAIG